MDSTPEKRQQSEIENNEALEMYEPSMLGDSDAPETVEKSGSADANLPKLEPVTWSAEEYFQGDKNALWYVLFAIVVLGLIAVDIFLIKSYTFSALILVMTAAVVVYIKRPARKINYALSVNQGLYIEDKLYRFEEFKAFGIIKDGDKHSIMLIPIKRFSPGVSVYFPEESGETIVDILGARLPMENLKLDAIDILVRKLRL